MQLLFLPIVSFLFTTINTHARELEFNSQYGHLILVRSDLKSMSGIMNWFRGNGLRIVVVRNACLHKQNSLIQATRSVIKCDKIKLSLILDKINDWVVFQLFAMKILNQFTHFNGHSNVFTQTSIFFKFSLIWNGAAYFGAVVGYLCGCHCVLFVLESVTEFVCMASDSDVSWCK